MPPSLQPIRLSPAQRFAAVFAPALLVLVFGAASYWGTVRERSSRMAVAESYRTIVVLQQVLTSAINAETGQRGYLLTGNPDYLDPFRRAEREVQGQLNELRRLTGDDGPAIAARVDSLTFDVGRKFDELSGTIALRQAGNAEGARQVARLWESLLSLSS